MKANLKLSFLLITIVMTFAIRAQESAPKKGSYLYYGQPNIEDNSMFIEEAFNQEGKIIQHISNLLFESDRFTYLYTNEIPMADYWHQFSFTASYVTLKDGTHGLGDLMLNYRPLLKGKNDWALVIPRFTLILPTGTAQAGLGDGGLGGQFNMAVTKRLNKFVTTHWNAGYTYIVNAKAYQRLTGGETILESTRNLSAVNLGLSSILILSKNFNLMAEYVYTSEIDRGQVTNSSIVNPGFRFAIQTGRTQIVPGLGVPFYGSHGSWKQSGLFLYLSIEPDYNND